MASWLTNACTAPERANPRMSGQSVSQNMKKPSRRLLPIASSQLASAIITGDAPSRVHQAGNRGGCLVELCLRVVTAALDGVGDAVGHMVVEQLEGHRLQGAGRGRNLLEYIDAVAVLVHHALQASDLPLDAPQPLLDCFFLVDVSRISHLRSHPFSFPLLARRLYTPYQY
jgi:hypothetical protein